MASLGLSKCGVGRDGVFVFTSGAAITKSWTSGQGRCPEPQKFILSELIVAHDSHPSAWKAEEEELKVNFCYKVSFRSA